MNKYIKMSLLGICLCVSMMVGETWGEKLVNVDNKNVRVVPITSPIDEVRARAVKGSVADQLKLGKAYYEGDGVKRDYKKAVEWYKKAAEQGSADAQFKLGYCYYNGYGVTQDYNESIRWYKKAAKQVSNLQVGKYFEFGNYPQGSGGEKKPIKWRILRRDSDSILVISERGLDCKRYNEEFKEITWADCTLRRWLNDDFYNRAFNSQEQSLIKTSNVTNNAGPSTNDRIFLLSVDEAKRLFDSDNDRFCKPTDYAVKNGAWQDSGDEIAYRGNAWWWLRSRGDDDSGAALVYIIGDINCSGSIVDDSNGVIRPAFKLAI